MFWFSENNVIDSEEFDELSCLLSYDNNFGNQKDFFDDEYNDSKDLAAFDLLQSAQAGCSNSSDTPIYTYLMQDSYNSTA